MSCLFGNYKIVLFEIKLYRKHKLARADVVGLISGISLGNINIYNLIDFSIADVKPFELEVDFFLDPSILVRQIEEWVFVRVTFC